MLVKKLIGNLEENHSISEEDKDGNDVGDLSGIRELSWHCK